MTEPPEKPESFLAQLKRRRVVRVAIGYGAAAFVVLQMADLVFPGLGIPDRYYRLLVIAALVGFPIVVVLAWLFDVTPDGVRLAGRRGESGRIVARLRPLTVYGGSVALVVAVIAAGVFWLRPRSATGEVASGADIIAVLPFNASGAELGVMGEGMVDLLARNLDQVGAIRTVDPRTILYRVERLGDGELLTPEHARRLGREVGAGSILTGSVVATGPRVRISGELTSVGGDRLASVAVDGSSDRMLALVDSFSVALLREIWRSRQPVPDLNMAAITTGDPDAIRAYLRGEHHFRASRWDSALAAFQRAVDFDSTFALAHYGLARAVLWTSRSDKGELLERATDRAWRYADRLPARERTLVLAQRLRFAGDVDAAIDTLRAYVERYPDDPEAWFTLADDEYHRESGTRPIEERLRRFERVLRLDPTFVPALVHPLELAFLARDTALISRYMSYLESAAPADTLAWRTYRAAEEAIREPGDLAALQAALARVLPTDEVEELGTRSRSGLLDPLTRQAIQLPAAMQRRMLDWIRARIEAGDRSPRTAETALVLATASGRLEEARALLDAAGTRSSLPRTDMNFYAMLPVYLGYVDGRSYDPPDVEGLLEGARLEARLLSAIDRSDAPAMRRSAEEARQLEARIGAPFWGTAARVSEAFALAVEGDTTTAWQRTGQALAHVNRQTAPYWFRWLAWMARGAGEDRARAVTLLENPLFIDPVYEAPRLQALAEAYAAEGDREAAIHAYRTVTEMLAAADPGIRVHAMIDSAATALRRLRRGADR